MNITLRSNNKLYIISESNKQSELFDITKYINSYLFIFYADGNLILNDKQIEYPSIHIITNNFKLYNNSIHIINLIINIKYNLSNIFDYISYGEIFSYYCISNINVYIRSNSGNYIKDIINYPESKNQFQLHINNPSNLKSEYKILFKYSSYNIQSSYDLIIFSFNLNNYLILKKHNNIFIPLYESPIIVTSNIIEFTIRFIGIDFNPINLDLNSMFCINN